MEYREKGNQSKGFELKRLQKEHPDFSPFVLLKLSLIRYGAVLTKRAKKRNRATESSIFIGCRLRTTVWRKRRICHSRYFSSEGWYVCLYQLRRNISGFLSN